MRAAVNGVDGIRERKNVFAIGIVILQGNFDLDAAFFPFHVNGRIVQRGFAAIDVLHEFRDTAGEAKFRALFAALISQRNLQSLVEECVFTQPCGQRVIAINRFVKNGWVSVKRDFVPVLRVLPVCFSLLVGLPFSYVCSHTAPSREISSSSQSESAFTTDTPTP